MTIPIGLICVLIKSGQVKQAGFMDNVRDFAKAPMKMIDQLPPLKGFDYSTPLPGSYVGGGLTGGLLGAGLGAGMGGLYGYMSAPDEIDPETGQQKSKWKHVWPAMGIGALGGGAVGLATGIHGAHGENQRFVDALGGLSPKLQHDYQRYHGPENIAKQLYGPGGLSDIGKGEL
jgi:hypothetical protein